MGNSPISAMLNPVGAIAREIGGPAGFFLDPLATMADKVGGPVGTIIDPARAFEEPKVEEKAKVDYDAEARQRTIANRANRPKVNQAFEDLEGQTGNRLKATSSAPKRTLFNAR